MSKPAFEAFAAAASPAVSPSRALVSAALAGLLCAATSACNESDSGTRYLAGPTCCSRGASDSGSGGASNTGGNATTGGAFNTGGNATTGGAFNTGGNATTGGASSTGGAGGAVTGTGGLGSGGSAQSAGGTQSDAAARSTGGADGGSIVPPPGDAGVHCSMDGAAPVVTSSVIVTDMTLERFTTDCDARHGVVEIPPHCGGFNTCMGFSYWADTGELTEHTCKGMSSCVGFSCVVCPP